MAPLFQLQIGVVVDGGSTSTDDDDDTNKCAERRWTGGGDGDPVLDQGSDLSHCALRERPDEPEQQANQSNADEQESVEQSQVRRRRLCALREKHRGLADRERHDQFSRISSSY